MRELPSGTVTFLFTDVEGSTALLHEVGAEEYSYTPETTWWWKLRDFLVAALGDTDFERCWNEGRSLSHADAVRRARASID